MAGIRLLYPTGFYRVLYHVANYIVINDCEGRDWDNVLAIWLGLGAPSLVGGSKFFKILWNSKGLLCFSRVRTDEGRAS